MRDLGRITLFIHDQDGQLEALPDQERLRALLEETPLITHHEDGSRTLVFDLPSGASKRDPAAAGVDTSLESLRHCGAVLGRLARSLGLPLTAALAESAELVAESELRGLPKARRH